MKFGLTQSVHPICRAADRGTGTDAFDATRGIQCNTAASYHVTFEEDGVTPVAMYLNKGIVYPFSITNILTTLDGALSAGDITLMY